MNCAFFLFFNRKLLPFLMCVYPDRSLMIPLSPSPPPFYHTFATAAIIPPPDQSISSARQMGSSVSPVYSEVYISESGCA